MLLSPGRRGTAPQATPTLAKKTLTCSSPPTTSRMANRHWLPPSSTTAIATTLATATTTEIPILLIIMMTTSTTPKRPRIQAYQHQTPPRTAQTPPPKSSLKRLPNGKRRRRARPKTCLQTHPACASRTGSLIPETTLCGIPAMSFGQAPTTAKNARRFANFGCSSAKKNAARWSRSRRRPFCAK